MGYTNPVNYAAGLLNELADAERAGWDVAAEIRAELAQVAPEAMAMDVSDLDDDQKALVASVRDRLAAVTSPEEKPAAEAPAAEAPAPAKASGGRPRTAKAAAAPESAVPPKAE